MEFFDKLTKKASETYKGAAEKTTKIAKEAKLKIRINDNKSKINELYQEIGKKVYQKHVAEENINIKEDLEEECTKIDILSSEIDTFHKEILALSDIKVCNECKEPLEKNAKFCSKCGAQQPEIEEDTAMEVEIVDETKSAEDLKEDVDIHEEQPQEEQQNAENNTDNQSEE